MTVILGILTGELDLTFVGLGAGVGKQDLVEAAVLNDQLRGLHGGLIVEIVGAVQDRVGALFEALDDRGVAVTQTVDSDAADEVKVLVAVLVKNVGAFAAFNGKRHTDMVAIEVFVTGSDDFCVGLIQFNHGKNPPIKIL